MNKNQVLALVLVLVVVLVVVIVVYHQSVVAPSPSGQYGQATPTAPYNGGTSGNASGSNNGGQTTTPPVTPSNVPAQYQSLYNGFQTALTTSNQDISGWNGSTYPVNYAVELINANGQQGPTVLGRLAAVKADLASDKAMGVKAVDLEAGFPLFDQNYYTYEGSSYTPQQFISFYQSVVAAAHALGIKVMIESNLSESTSNTGDPLNPGAYYRTLTWAQFVALRSADNVTIAEKIKPDYLILQTEPTTDAFDVGKSPIASQLNNPVADTQMISQFVSDLNSANIPGLHTSLQVGSGFGMWQTSNWQQYLSGLTAINGLDKIDTHMFFFGPADPADEVSIALQVADAAHTAGKGVTMSEVWPNKTAATPLAQIWVANPVDPTADYVARQTYSFWEPLDEQYLLMFVKMANYKKFDYISPFMGLGALNWAYLDYANTPCVQVYPANGTKNATCDGQITKAENQLAGNALSSNQLSPIGAAYQSDIATYSSK